MLKKLIVYCAAVLLTGCAAQSGRDYTATAATFRGGNIKEVLKKWGAPNQQVTGPDGNTAYIYRKEGYTYVGGQYSPSVGVNVNSRGAPVIVTTPNTNPWSRNILLHCMMVFVTNPQGKIIHTMSQGNGCSGSFKLGHT